jgi:calcineurin-like phosphoesterase family protein
MARFFTADLHLGHRNIASYEPERARAAGVVPLDGPADDATQSRLDSFIIDRWNDVVRPDDEVWLLGDACMGRLDRTIEQLGRLHGRIVLVPGNHDRVWAGDHRRGQWWDRYLAAGIDEIVDGTATLELADGTVVDIDHFPYEGDSGDEDRHVEWRPVDHGRVLLHGHVHSSWRTNGRMINVGVDVWDHAPVPEEELLGLVAAAR